MSGFFSFRRATVGAASSAAAAGRDRGCPGPLCGQLVPISMSTGTWLVRMSYTAERARDGGFAFPVSERGCPHRCCARIAKARSVAAATGARTRKWEQPRRRLRSSARLGERGRQGGPVRYAKTACGVVADPCLAASDSGEVVAAFGDVEERRRL